MEDKMEIEQPQQVYAQSKERKMYLLSEEDWVLLHPPKPIRRTYDQNIQSSYWAARFIMNFAEILSSHYKEKVKKFQANTIIKAMVLFHRLKALQQLEIVKEEKTKMYSDDINTISCLFIAAKSDDWDLECELFAQLLQAMKNEAKQNVQRQRSPESKFLIKDIGQLNEQGMQKYIEDITKVIGEIDVKQQRVIKDQLLHAESNILVLLGFELQVESHQSYIQSFVKEWQKQQGENIPSEMQEFLNKILSNSYDVYKFNMCLYYHPVQLALATIETSRINCKYIIPELNNQPWWKFFNDEKKMINIQEENQIKEPYQFLKIMGQSLRRDIIYL